MLKERLIEANVIVPGEFELKHAGRVDYYVDMKRTVTKPELLEELVGEMSKHVTAKAIAGVELGSVPLLVGISLRMKIPYVIVRKEEKAYGMHGILIGDVNKGQSFDFIEDVVSTGNSSLKAIELLRGRGAKISRVICAVERELGARQLLMDNDILLTSVFRASELVK